MWGLVLVTALLTAVNPVRIGVNLVIISRPRPVANLFVYWAGCVVIGIPAMLIPLLLLNLIPSFSAAADGLGTSGPSPVVRYIQLGIGVLALAVALWIVLVPVLRRRSKTLEPAEVGAGANLKSNSRTAVSTLPKHRRPTPANGGNLLGRLFRRLRAWWNSDSLWVALLMGLGTGPPIDGMLIVIAAILAAGVTLGIQLSAAVAYVIGTLVVVELMLIGYVAAPARTETLVRWLHEWTRAHFRLIIVTLLGIVRVFSVAMGLGLLG